MTPEARGPTVASRVRTRVSRCARPLRRSESACLGHPGRTASIIATLDNTRDAGGLRRRPEIVPRVTLVAAVAENGVIGRDNALPWRLPDDLRRFRALTLGHTVIMGRRTYDSLGRPLPERSNIVISRDPARRIEGVTVVGSLEAALSRLPDDAEAFVIGGAEIYRLALPVADRLVLTEVRASYKGDVRFPQWDRGRFVEAAREACVDAASGVRYDVVTYERRPGGDGMAA